MDFENESDHDHDEDGHVCGPDCFVAATEIVPEHVLKAHGAMLGLAMDSVFEANDIITASALLRMSIGFGPKLFHKAGRAIPGGCDGTDDCDLSCQAAYKQSMASGFYKDLLPDEHGDAIACIPMYMELVATLMMAISIYADDEGAQELLLQLESFLAHFDWHGIKNEMKAWHDAEMNSRLKTKLEGMNEDEVAAELLRELGI